MNSLPCIIRALLLLSMILWGGIIYSNTLDVPFYFDDTSNIEENRAIHLRDFSLSSLLGAGEKSILPKRVVANISFAVNQYFHGNAVPGYHLVNIAIHLITTLFLFFFVRSTLVLNAQWDRSESTNPDTIAFAVAFLWMVHPLQVQSVTYIVQRMNSLSAMFFIVAMYGYAQGRISETGRVSRLWFLGAFISGLFALGSKEIAATLPFCILLYEWFFFQDLSLAWLKKKAPWLLGVLLFLGAVAFFYLGKDPFRTILATYQVRDFTLTERVFTEFRVIVHYISLLFFPHPSRLSLEYDFLVSQSLFEPLSTLFSFGLILVLLLFAAINARKHRLVAFSIFWFLGNLVIESSFIGLEIIFEHRTYLPSMMFFVPAMVFCCREMRKDWLLISGLAVAIVFLSFWTYERNSLWLNPVVFWYDCTIKAPQNPRPYNNLGLALAEAGNSDAAIKNYQKALVLKPSFVEAHNNLGIALKNMGIFDEAVLHFRQALIFNHNNAKAHNNLGSLLARQGNYTEALYHLREALRFDPQYAEASNNLGNLMQLLGRYDEAVQYYRQALRINPDYPSAQYNMGIAIKRSGNR
ncbi:MAG: tetratricopeptide repeat protein [Proteobacteria bacterium]|nr:tetratricopeptide repeat protein [Pseudomonadota bacterium]MBU1710586.1 tetratricopeptide repeat protein [Pseudomonadota bacterium]